MSVDVDAVVVGAGPNGLTAAAVLARHGWSVLVVEAAGTIGGGTRSAEVTLPGYVHDICSAIHPLAASSPVFAELGLTDHGVEWVQPDAPLAHPFDDGTAMTLERSVDDTAAKLGDDARRYHRLMDPLVARWDQLVEGVLGPVHRVRHPLTMARFGVRIPLPAEVLCRRVLSTRNAQALLTGIAAHANMPLTHLPTTAFALVLGGAGHAVGWPLPRGGSQTIADALAAIVTDHGGKIETGQRVRSLAELPSSRAVLLDVSPRQLDAITSEGGGDVLPARYRRALRQFKRGPGAFKVDYALDGPVPWRSPECARAATVHLGGTFEEIAASERAVGAGQAPERPYVIAVQSSLFDSSRAPAGHHTLWAYCHVPNGCTVDMTERIEAQLERFAPGFRDRVLQRHVRTPADIEADNPNMLGGDIAGGDHSLLQLVRRPALRLDPYATPNPRLFLCSSSTPPGAGVHGMCGYHAAQSALRRHG